MTTPKRSGMSAGSSSSPKIPSAADLVDAKVGSGKLRSNEKDKLIHIYEVFFCDDGSVYSEEFEGKMVALHLDHDYPNVWFLFLRSLKAYCEFRRSMDNSFPPTWQELCSALKMKVVTTSPPQGQTKVIDDDEIGTFVKNRVAIYCNRKDVKNIGCFLDGFVAWRVVTPLSPSEPFFDQNPKITIHVPNRRRRAREFAQDSIWSRPEVQVRITGAQGGRTLGTRRMCAQGI